MWLTILLCCLLCVKLVQNYTHWFLITHSGVRPRYLLVTTISVIILTLAGYTDEGIGFNLSLTATHTRRASSLSELLLSDSSVSGETCFCL